MPNSKKLCRRGWPRLKLGSDRLTPVVNRGFTSSHIPPLTIVERVEETHPSTSGGWTGDLGHVRFCRCRSGRAPETNEEPACDIPISDPPSSHNERTWH